MTGRRAAAWFGRIVAWGVVALAVASIVVAVVVPRLAGATPYAVMTGSMEPTYAAGSLVVVRPVDGPGDLGVGKVITYQRRSGEAQTVTHRVVGMQQSRDGQLRLVTRGDANTIADPEPVVPVQVRGAVWYSVPHLGRVYGWLSGDQREAGTQLVALVLAGYAAIMGVGAVRDRHRARRGLQEARE